MRITTVSKRSSQAKKASRFDLILSNYNQEEEMLTHFCVPECTKIELKLENQERKSIDRTKVNPETFL